jgi:DNA-directed RNA polymerase subunit alpha
MKEILLPNKITVTPGDSKNEGVLTVEPCYQGYGTTVGNALRRVLLSSLPGAAVYAVKVKGAHHEFSTIKGVKEDVLGLILNIKQIRLKSFSDETVKLTLKAKGTGIIKAGDIEKNSDIEVVNKDQVICELTDKDAELDMELYINRGRGYLPVEERDKGDLDVGAIAIDSIYSPVVNVGFKVENTRVGEITNYDKLTLAVETDGSITPEEAIDQAVKVISDYFTVVATRGIPPAPEPIIEIAKPKAAVKKSKEVKEDKEEVILNEDDSAIEVKEEKKPAKKAAKKTTKK